MNHDLSPLRIRTYQNNGTVRAFSFYDPEVITRTLRDLNVSTLFARETILMADGDLAVSMPTKELARIDLVTDRISVWDFPFVLGAPVELTEAEFRESIEHPPHSSTDRVADLPAFLQIAMAGGQQYFFCMEIVGGQAALRASRIEAMLEAGVLVFGLRTGGVGILNLANLADHSVHPEPTASSGDEPGENGVDYDSADDQRELSSER